MQLLKWRSRCCCLSSCCCCSCDGGRDSTMGSSLRTLGAILQCACAITALGSVFLGFHCNRLICLCLVLWLLQDASVFSGTFSTGGIAASLVLLSSCILFARKNRHGAKSTATKRGNRQTRTPVRSFLYFVPVLLALCLFL